MVFLIVIGNKMKFYIDDGSTEYGTSHATPLTLNPFGVDIEGDTNVTGDITIGGTLTVTEPNEIYYKGETLDARFHSLDNDYYTEAESDARFHSLDNAYYTETESDARFVTVAGDTMTGNLTVDSSKQIYYKGQTLDARFVNVTGDTMTGNLVVESETVNPKLTLWSKKHR